MRSQLVIFCAAIVSAILATDAAVARPHGAPSEDAPVSSAPPQEASLAYTLNLANLPVPILDDHPAWIAVYNRAWVLAKQNIRPGTTANGLVPQWIDEGLSLNKIWQWDSAFISLFAKYSNGEFPSIEMLENFYRKQRANGYISREIKETDGLDADYLVYGVNSYANPPLFAFAEWEHYLYTGDASHFTKVIVSNGIDPGVSRTVLQRLVAYFNWIKADTLTHMPDGYYASDGYGNGMDDSPRNSIGPRGAWLCITSQQAMAAYYIAKIAGVVGDTATQSVFTGEYNTLKDLVNNTMWDSADGMYYDLNASRQMSRVKTIASFWPMISKIANQAQSDALAQHVKDPAEFWRPNLLPTLAASESDYVYPTGEYWRGAVWPPTTFMTVRGLAENGHADLAKRIADNNIDMLSRVLVKTGTIWENNAPELDGPSLDSVPDFVGWGGVGPITMLIENVLGLRVNAPANTITWDLREQGRHGIQNLRYKTGTISRLECAPRSHPSDTATVTVSTDVPFTLVARIAGRDISQAIAVGQNTYVFTNTIRVNQPPVAKANGNYIGAVNKPVSFSSAGSFDLEGPVAGYLWDFGDGTISNAPNPTHTYTSIQHYSVTLTVTDSQGLTAIAPTNADITNLGYPSCRAAKAIYSHIKRFQFGGIDNASGSDGYRDFTTLNANIVAGRSYPLTVTMGRGSAGADRERFRVWVDWNQNNNFDDPGEFVVSQDNVTLVENGLINASLAIPANAKPGKTAMRVLLAYFKASENPGPYGYFESGEVEDYAITVSGGTGNQPPIARANGPYSGVVSVPIAFSSAGSSDPDGTIASYSWTFGDGTTSTVANPAKAYAAPGAYTATLLVTDNLGATNASSVPVTVASAAPSIVTQPASQAVSAGQSATFSVVASGAAPLSYQWFKNGASVSGATAASYTTPATTSADNGASYFVRVSNAAGSVNSNSVALTVTTQCSYSISPTGASYVAAGGSGSVSVTAGAGCAWTTVSNASWITVTGGASGAGNGSLAYSVAANAGTTSRNGTLTIAGSTFTVTQAGGVANQPPVARPNGPYSGATGAVIAFSSAGSSDPDGTLAAYLWAFGDGSTSTLANPSKSYATAGTYAVSLRVTDNQGASTTATTTATATDGGITAETEPNNGAAQANGPVASNVAVSGAVVNTEADWFTFTLAGPATVSIAAQLTGDTSTTFVLVHESNLNQYLAWPTSTTGGLLSGGANVTQAGRYYVGLYRWAAGTSNYSLKVTY
jgi:PKD repeat protein